MNDTGKSIHDSLLGYPNSPRGRCKACGSPMELYSLDFRQSTKVMKCTRCGMLHEYKKDIIGKWKLQKAQKPDLPVR